MLRDRSDSRPWLEDGSWRSESIKAIEAIVGPGETAGALWRLVCHRVADYVARQRDDRSRGSAWHGPVISHGVFIDVDGDHVVLRGREGADHLIFDEALEVAAVLDRAVTHAIRNAVEGAK